MAAAEPSAHSWKWHDRNRYRNRYRDRFRYLRAAGINTEASDYERFSIATAIAIPMPIPTPFSKVLKNPFLFGKDFYVSSTDLDLERDVYLSGTSRFWKCTLIS